MIPSDRLRSSAAAAALLGAALAVLPAAAASQPTVDLQLKAATCETSRLVDNQGKFSSSESIECTLVESGHGSGSFDPRYGTLRLHGVRYRTECHGTFTDVQRTKKTWSCAGTGSGTGTATLNVFKMPFQPANTPRFSMPESIRYKPNCSTGMPSSVLEPFALGQDEAPIVTSVPCSSTSCLPARGAKIEFHYRGTPVMVAPTAAKIQKGNPRGSKVTFAVMINVAVDAQFDHAVPVGRVQGASCVP